MSLWERKKYRAMLRIQDEAYRLVRERGFAATTVDEIAAAAEVSPATVYRYFGTKEGILLWDELELPATELLVAALGEGSVLDALVASFRGAAERGFHLPEEEVRERVRFLLEQPALRSAVRDAAARYETELAGLLEREAGTASFDARIVAAVATATMLAAIEAWAASDRGIVAVTEDAVTALRRALGG